MLRRKALITLGSQVGIQLIGLLTGILVARLLGPVGRGELAAIIAWVSMVSYLGNLGLPVAYIYAAAREPERSRQLLGNGLLAALIQWPALMLLGVPVLMLALAKYGQETFHLAVLYLCLYIPLNLLTLYANAILQGLGQYGGFNAVRLCVPISYLAGLGVLLGLHQMTLAGVLTANLFSNVATLALSLLLVLPVVRDIGGGHSLFDLTALRRDARYGISAHLGTVQPFDGLRVDVLFLTVLATAHDLGLYMAALAGAGLIKAQGVALGMVLMPEVAKRAATGEQRKVIARFGAFALLLGGATATVALIWAEPLIELVYGGAFVAAAPTLRVLVLYGVVASLYRVLADGLRGMGHPLRASTAELASMGIGIPAIVVLAPSLGAMGAAAGVGLASVAALTVVLFPLLDRRSPSKRERRSAKGISLDGPLAADEDGHNS